MPMRSFAMQRNPRCCFQDMESASKDLVMTSQTTRLATRLARLACAALCLALSPLAAAADYSFGAVPQFEARRLSEIWTPILAEIEARTGIAMHMVGSPRIPEFEQAFARGEFDITYMNPYHALVARESQGYRPLVRDGARQLFGVLVVAKGSGFSQVSDLEGRKIAFPAPNALGASLLMRADLTRRHGLGFTPDYVNTHSSAYLNVLLGEADAAGGVMGTFNALDPEIRDRLEVIYETERLAPHPIMVHPRVPAEDAERIRQALLDMSQTEDGRALLSQIPMTQAVSATEADYLPLETLGLEDFYVDTGVN